MPSIPGAQPLFSRTLRPRGMVFRLDVYEGRNAHVYLSIRESRQDLDGIPQPGRICLNPDAVPLMREALDEVHTFFRGYNVSEDVAPDAA